MSAAPSSAAPFIAGSEAGREPEGAAAARGEAILLARIREVSLTRLVIAYISSGLIFMLLPGTFLGVWNLLQISGRESVASISASWLQAHGHAQVFGWIGSFILGIGFYSIPKLRGTARGAFAAAWICWGMWTLGVALRWAANVYAWEWRVLLPVSAILELSAFLIFFRAVSQHRPKAAGQGTRLEPWIWIVASAASGLLVVLIVNLWACFFLALRGSSPALPHRVDQQYLALIAWGFLVPFVWGFSAKWMPVFLGLKSMRTGVMFSALAFNIGGLVLVGSEDFKAATVAFAAGAALSIAALRMFEPGRQAAKTRGVHGSFPVFVRIAYGWLLAAGLLGAAASQWDHSGGIWGASRHALTVGFIATMVFCVGQRILPAFAGMRLLWSTRLMFAGLALINLGCILRVSSEVLAHQGYAAWAWPVLPISAIFELSGVMAFAMNLFGTFLLEPSRATKEPLIVLRGEIGGGATQAN